MNCFNCGNIINVGDSICSFCGAKVNTVKTNFLNYIGLSDSLAGYQKSYKLVLLINIIKNFNENREALVSQVISDVRKFYLGRANQGLLTDIDVDPRIANIQESTDYDVFAVMKSQPYNVINKKGFLFMNRNSSNELVFVLHDDITASMSDYEFEKLNGLLNHKLKLYYSKYNLEATSEDDSLATQSKEAQESIYDNEKYDNLEIINISTLSQRAKNILMRNGIFTIGELKAYIKTNSLYDLKYMGKKTIDEIHQLLENDVVSLSGSNDIGKEKKELTIAQAFSENTYNLFVKYCDRKGLELLSELKGFDFDTLIFENGFGVGKIQKIKDRYNDVLENIDKYSDNSYVCSIQQESKLSIHFTNENLPIDVLKNFGISEQLITELKENKFEIVDHLKETINSEELKLKLFKKIGKRKIDLIIGALKSLEKSLYDIANDLLQKIRNERSFEIYIKRSEGFTLQEIADEYNLTRERVRQIERVFHNKIKPLMLALVFNYFAENDVNYIHVQQVLDIFDDDSFDKVIIHSLNSCNELEYLDFAEMYIVKKSKEQNTFEELRAVATEFIGDGVNLYDKLDELDEMLAGKGYSYIDADAFLNLLIACNAHFYGDYVVFSRQSYGYLCAKVVGKYFKNGINLYSDDDLNLLREYARKEFGALKLPENNRALASRLDSYLIIVDRGRSNVIENIDVDLNVLEEVKNFIDMNDRSTLYYNEIFSEYEGLLCMTTGITNHYCLHGILSYYYPENYTYSRDFLTKKGDGYISVSIDERIDNILKSEGHALRRIELKNRLVGCSDVMILNAIYKNDSLIQWDANYYNSMNNIRFEEFEREDLEIILEIIINDNDGYCSDRLVYEAVTEQMPEFCHRNCIENHTNLFYILSALFKGKYKFSQPHICVNDLFDDLNTKNVVMHFLNDTNHISYSECSKLAEKMRWSPVTIGMVFSDLEKEYFRVSQDEYIKKDLISIPSQILSDISTMIASKLNDVGYLSLVGFAEFEDFCDVGYEWNTFLLSSLVENFDIGYKIIQPQIKDRRYQKSIIIPNDCSEDSYDKIVAATMRHHNIETLRGNQFLQFLVLHHLTTKAIPKELQMSEVIKYDDGVYSV